MGVTIKTPATGSADLTTIDLLRPRVGLTCPDEDDWLNILIDVASAAVADHCKRVFIRQVYEESLPGSGMTLLTLSRAPIVAVNSVTISGVVVSDYTIEHYEAALLHREAGWPYGRGGGVGNLEPHPDPLRVRLNVVVDYDAGWDLVDVDPMTLPWPISHAALLTAAELYRQDKSEGFGQLISRRMADTTETYAQVASEVAASGLPGGAVSLLGKYVQRDLV